MTEGDHDGGLVCAGVDLEVLADDDEARVVVVRVLHSVVHYVEPVK